MDISLHPRVTQVQKQYIITSKTKVNTADSSHPLKMTVVCNANNLVGFLGFFVKPKAPPFDLVEL